MTDAAKQTELEWIEARLKQLRMDEDHIRQARQEALARAAQLLTAFPIGTVLAVSSGLTKVNYVRLTSVTASEGWGRGGPFRLRYKGRTIRKDGTDGEREMDIWYIEKARVAQPDEYPQPKAKSPTT